MTIRKIFLLILCVCLLAGCNSATTSAKWQREPVSADITPYAKRAVEVIDAYLSFQMSADEAGAAIDEVYKRMDGWGIRTKDDIYSDHERDIVSDIYDVSGRNLARSTDVKIRQYRDKIAFAIGEPVTGYVYEAERNIWDEDDPLADLIDINGIPFDSGMADVTDDSCTCALFFDEMNVPKILDLQEWIVPIYNCLLTESKNVHLSIYYDRYGQSVCNISISVYDGQFSGDVGRMDAVWKKAWDEFSATYTYEQMAEMDGYPPQFAALNPLYEFDSIDDLATALKVAGEFAGVQ